MEVLSTGATSTVTTCSPSGLSAAFSAVQPDKSDMKHNNAMILTMKLCTIFRTVLSPSAASRARRDIEFAHRRKRCAPERSEEHTSELQSHSDLVCRLLLEKKKK